MVSKLKKVKYPDVYKKIHDEIERDNEKEGRRWGAFSSLQLSGEYKKFLKNKNPKGSGGLRQWVDEKWKDQYGRPCGSRKGKEVVKCRPTVRINKSTPVTWGELSKRGEKEKAIREKKKVGMGKRAPAIKRSRNPQGQLEFKKNKPLYKVETSSRKGYKGMVYVMVNGKKVLKHFKDAKKMDKKPKYWSTKYKK